jgi:hypothetical protein
MKNKEVALRVFEELDKKNPGIFKELCVDGARIYMPGRSEPYTVSEIIELVSMFYDGLPDYAHTIEDVISEGEKVVVRGNAPHAVEGCSGSDVTFYATFSFGAAPSSSASSASFASKAGSD